MSNVTSLLKTVKSVEDEAAKGQRALEQTINSVKQEIKVIAPPSDHLHHSNLLLFLDLTIC